MTPDASNTIFQKAVAFVNQTNRHLFLTGKAGTGKTTFLKFIRDHSFKKMAIVAPTGVAAINAGGVTIHSFFQLPFGPFIPSEAGLWGSYNGELNNRSSLLKNQRLQYSKKQVIQELDLLVIDEISMVRADLLDAVDTVMRHVRKQPLMPFGGVQMIYIGDLFQLPPVVKNEEWEVLEEYYKSPFFFDALCLQHAPPLYIELKKIYRQKDDMFINILNNIRNNCCTSNDLDILHQHYNPTFSPGKEEKFITLTSHNSKADFINQQELNKLPGKLYKYEAEISGEFNERSFPAEKELQLKLGAQIMFLRNDKGEIRKFYNGKIGTITKIEREKITVTFPNERDELEIEKETWENIKYNYNTQSDDIEEEPLGKFTQYPIKLAWAITIHKSQGLTFEKAVIDAGASFAPGQVYVSLSRLTSINGLVLHSRILPGCISTNSRVIDYVQNEMEEDHLQETLEKEQREYIKNMLLQSFYWQKLADAVIAHLLAYEHRQIPKKDECINWATNLSEDVNQQNDIAQKFIRQLEFLFLTCEQDGYKKLHDRTKAATTFFLTAIEDNLLPAINKHLDQVKVRQKVKKYVKELQQLVVLFKRKKTHLQQALQLSEALFASVDMTELMQMVEHNQKAPATEEPVEIKKEKQSAGLVKGESNKISLDLFKQGKPIADIAVERGMAESTIEGHLANFIKTGEIDILNLVNSRTLDKVSALLALNPEMDFSEIKQKISNISYGAIKAVLGYRERLKNEAF